MSEEFKLIATTASAIGIALLVTKAYITYKPTAPLRVFLAMPIVTLLLPLFALTFLVLAAYRQIIKAILSAQLRSKFGGLVEGFDTFFLPEGVRRNPTCILYMAEYNSKSPQRFEDVAKEVLQKQLSELTYISKIFSTLHYFMGYSYFVRDDFKFGECVKPLKKTTCTGGEVSMDDFLALVAEVSNLPLPRNGECLWELLIGTQPVKWGKEVQAEGKALYPIMLRFQHCMGDGYSIMKLVAAVFTNHDMSMKLPGPKQKPQSHGSGTGATDASKNSFSLTYNSFKHYLSLLYAFVFSLTTFLIQRTFSLDDNNSLHGPPLTNKKHFYIGFEETPRYVEVIKNIKSRIPGCSFMDVFLTAFSASFAEYFEKKPDRVPVYITVALPETSMATDMDTMQSYKPVMVNNLVISVRKLPIIINPEDNEAPLLTRLRVVQKKRYLSGPYVTEMNALMQQIFFSYLPEPVVQYIMERFRYTLMLSNVPSTPALTLRGGCLLHGVYGFSTHRDRTGLSVTLVTYRGRLQMTFLVDKMLISEQKDARSIIDNVYKYLDLLDAETGGSARTGTSKVV